jgi:ribosome biogenesis GTPase A
VQWIRFQDNLLLVDSPGTINNKLVKEDETMFMKLALTNNTSYNNIWLSRLSDYSFQTLIFNLSFQEKIKPFFHEVIPSKEVFFNFLAQKYNFKVPGGKWDLMRTYEKFIREIQLGKWGTITWEKPPR